MHRTCLALLVAFVLGAAVCGRAQGVDVTAHVELQWQKKKSSQPKDQSNVVLWLVPVKGWAGPRPRAQGVEAHPKLVQKSKRFEPHMLVVETGSSVDFPNRDPFFHNVFSLFDGKRFDLGLYEAGSTRSVRFSRTGICYIFCNIHPQMSAVVVVVDTPYFAVSNRAGEIVLPHVPSGRYQLNVWAEHCSRRDLKEAAREVEVGPQGADFGAIRLEESPKLVMAHPNKYGRSYDSQVFSSPIYSQP